MNYINFLLKNWLFVAITAIGIALLTFGVSVVRTDKYEAHAKLLVIQQGQEKIDPYTASKSAENISSILKEVIYTNSFFKRVINADYFITDNFGSTDEKKLKKWQQTVEIETVNDTGILNIKVFNKDKTQAEQIAHAIANVLVTNGKEYHGGGDDIAIRIIDGPSVSDKTVVPNIPEDTGLGFILGGVIGFMILIARYESGKRSVITLDTLKEIFWKKDLMASVSENDEFISHKIAENLKVNLQKMQQSGNK